MGVENIGNVQRLVQQMQQPGAASLDRSRSMSGLAPRHGRAEPRSDRRHGPFRDRSARSRERSDGSAASRQHSPRQTTTLPQTMQDLNDRFTALEDRMGTVERYTRMHAQTIAMSDEAITQNHRRVVELDDDISRYKQFITSTQHNH